ncbi:MAG: hypothetical protein AAFN92_09040, partial [Bacteroidota bacterium]
MSDRYTSWPTTFLLLFWLLSASFLAGQDNVRLLNGASFISESAVSSAASRLATELPNRDVRISYVANFVTVQDRYREYSEKELMDFAQSPNTDGFQPPTQADREAAVNDAIHYALTEVVDSENTIHIIYAVSVSLDEQAQEQFEVRKFFSFGDQVPRRDEQIVEQILPSPELLAAGAVADNDVYLRDYVEELIAALSDPGYVVNGTVEYKGDWYYDGDTIFYFYVPDEIVSTEVPGFRTVRLLTNDNYPVDPVNWVEVGEISAAGPIIANTSGGTANLKIKAEHFAGIAQLEGRFGTKTTSVWFYPVNVDIELSNEDVVETHTLEPITVTLTNNGYEWIDHPSLTLQISLADPIYDPGDPNAMGIFRSIRFAPGEKAEYIWEWDEEVCDKIRYIGSAQKAISGTEDVAVIQRLVKCPIELSLSAETTHLNDEGGPLRSVTGDTLYVVHEDWFNERDVKFKLVPDVLPLYYWNHGDGEEDDEPQWEGKWNGNTTSTDNYPQFTADLDAQLNFGSNYFPNKNPTFAEDVVLTLVEQLLKNPQLVAEFGEPDFANHSLWSKEKHYQTINAKAFGEDHEATVAFLHSNKQAVKIGFPGLTSKLVSGIKKFKKFSDKVQSYTAFGADSLFSFSLSISEKVEFYNKEDKNSPDYFNENKLDFSLGGGFAVKLDKIFIPGLTYHVPGLGGINPTLKGALC